MDQVGVGRDEAREEAVGGQSVRVCPKFPLLWMCFSGAQVGPQQWKWPSPDPKSFRKHPPAGAGSVCTGQGRAGPDLWEWPLLLVLPPGTSPTLPPPSGPTKVSEATFLWASWPHHPFLGFGPQPGDGWNDLEIDYFHPRKRRITVILSQCDPE